MYKNYNYGSTLKPLKSLNCQSKLVDSDKTLSFLGNGMHVWYVHWLWHWLWHWQWHCRTLSGVVWNCLASACIGI